MKFSYEKVKDPTFFREGRLPSHADFIAYESLQDLREDNRTWYMSLNGTWKIQYAENLSEIPKGYETTRSEEHTSELQSP